MEDYVGLQIQPRTKIRFLERCSKRGDFLTPGGDLGFWLTTGDWFCDTIGTRFTENFT